MGGGSWMDIPEKYKPHWSSWKIEGTPFEESQKRLHARGLHDPWVRNEVWIFKLPRHRMLPTQVFRRGLIPGFLLFLGLVTVEKIYFKDSGSSHH